MNTLMRIFAVGAFLASGSLAYALDVNDIANLSKAKAGDEVIIAQIRATKARFVLTADDIIRLKKEGASDAVIKAMIETASAPAAAEAPAVPAQERPAPRPESERAYVQPAPPPPQPQVIETQPAQTTVIEKHYYPAPQTVYYPAPATTYYYVPARPACYPTYYSSYGHCSSGYYGGAYYGVGLSGRIRVSRNFSLGFRL